MATVHHGKELVYSGDNLEDARQIAYNTPLEGKGIALRFNGKIIFTRT